MFMASEIADCPLKIIKSTLNDAFPPKEGKKERRKEGESK